MSDRVPAQEKRTRFMAWVTKYALTDGILKMQVEDCFDTSPDMVKKINGPANTFFHGNDWHRSHEEAIARAKEMQAAKLKSIDKQRARIAALTFEDQS
jgi:hypothetical protein